MDDQSKDRSPIVEEQGCPQPAPPKFPEGGLRAWLVVLGAWCVSFSSFGYLNGYGVYQDYYTKHLLAGEASSTIAWIGSVQVFFLFAGGIVGGPLFDRFGAVILYLPCMLSVLSVMLTSLCTKYYQLMLAQAILGGIANGTVFAPSMACVGHYFHARRAAALGVTVSGSSLGGVLFPIAISRMLRNPSLGFAWTVRIMGFLILVLLSIACVAIKGRLPPRAGKILLPRAFLHLPYTLITFSIFFMMWGMFTPFFYLPQYAQLHGMSSNLSSYVLSVLNAASFFGRVLPGFLADKIGRFNTLCVEGIVTGILLLCWPACKSNASILAFGALYGLFSGGIVSLMSPCIAQVTPDPRNMGTYLGMGMTIVAVAGLTGSPITGALIENSGSYTSAAVFCGVVVLFGVVLTFIAKIRLDKKLFARV
ncbi:hypothetical protein ASPZODRAFT_89959 [Penicilliopsis zonata CBS 506.65]|uniref:Major facilitator superfamily (MFS) profile domain-containing protein n=1 Tax=Penicilliopsis zonata CBS 506.65 TaxID=1073090 RepID=A0A1L9SSD0_9EURO|nr:hypothetical protein ASPZODRAFT_89959 [Penicilliopsis zonata CBS 506.65]OJJ50115.1 hypothetical protein ASPZODRAFT_89959 [Penicilliopsis zonata CBS 506.65]